MSLLSRGIAALFLSALCAGADADQIRLKDGTELAGTLVGKDSYSVVVKLPRASVASINGRPLAEPVTVGAKAPEFVAMDLDGATHALSQHQGSVTLLHFWATWCPHCRNDLPLMKTLFERYRQQGLKMLTVSVDRDVAKLRSFVRDQQVAFPVIAAYDRSEPARDFSGLPELYEMGGIPAYFVIGPDGIIAKVISGSVVESDTDLEGELKRLLAALPRPASRRP